jgi:hypothetical protein
MRRRSWRSRRVGLLEGLATLPVLAASLAFSIAGWGADLPPARSHAPVASPTRDKESEDAPDLGFAWGSLWLTPFIAPAYTPELGLVVAAGAMMSFRADPASPRTSVPFSAAYGTSGAIVLDARVRSYWFRDRLRLDVDAWFKDLEDHYFGADYETERRRALGDATRYHRRAFQIKPAIFGRLYQDVYAGASLDLNGTEATEVNPVMARDPAVLASGTEVLDIGTGPILRIDSRDFPQNATSGLLLQGSYTLLRSWHAPRPSYQVVDIDYRQYVGVAALRGTLAWTVHARKGIGNVPWSELGGLGSPYDMRGYRWGQYRQKATAFTTIEYRLTPLDAGGWGRHGAVCWVGAGTLGGSFTELEGVLPNAGVGYRLVVQARLNARLDVGFGRASRALYVNFSEAF